MFEPVPPKPDEVRHFVQRMIDDAYNFASMIRRAREQAQQDKTKPKWPYLIKTK